MTEASPRGLSPLAGWLTVEQAASRAGLDAWRVRDLAVLGGIPKAYGPFRSIHDSAYRIFIDEADLDAWVAAGKPADSRYRRPPPPPPPPQPVKADTSSAPLLIALALLAAAFVGYLCGALS